MLDFALSQLLFYAVIALVLFVPGYLLLLATNIYRKFSSLEQFVLAFGSSIVIMDFLIILLGKSFFHISRTSILVSLLMFLFVCMGIYFLRKKNGSLKKSERTELPANKATNLAVLLLFLTIFINTIYFKDAIFPTATDLGHHMYWSKTIAVSRQLPVYEKADINEQLQIGKPAPIADFIIGEHIIFAVISLLSGAQFISAFPVIILYLIHFMSLLAIFILTRELFKDLKQREQISLIALLFIGPLYALASPQAKFASGGVIGNTIGNLFIPLAILLYVKAFSEKKSELLAYALFISLGMAYTHHLSTFVFVFLSFFSFCAFAFINYKTFASELRGWLKLVLTPSVLAVLAMCLIFVFALYMPTYLNSKAIDTAVGAPSKATRMGLTFAELRGTAGEARFAFAVFGLFLLLLTRKIEKYKQAFLFGWLFALTIMSLRPDLLFVDIPSNRIASYIVFPTAIVAAYMFTLIINSFKNTTKDKLYIKPIFSLFIFLIFITFVVSDGLRDDASALNSDSSTTKAIQTYAASQYLASKTNEQDIILKDHNYLSGDSWIKLAFMRGYNYPLSRGYFKRYDDVVKQREQCTNFMITSPNSPDAQKCFMGTNTDFIMLNPKMDSSQFQKSNEFWQIYASNEVAIYYKAK